MKLGPTRRPDRPLGADAAAYWGEVGGPLLAEAAAPGLEWFREGDAKLGEDLRAHELLRRWRSGAQDLVSAGPAPSRGEAAVGGEQAPRLAPAAAVVRGDEAAACAASEASSGADADVCVPDLWAWSRGSTVASASERGDPRAAWGPWAKASSASSSSSGGDAAAGPGPAAAAGIAPTGCIIQWAAPAACARSACRPSSQYGPPPSAPTPRRAATALALAGLLAKAAAHLESVLPGSLVLLCAVAATVALTAKAGGDEHPQKAAGFAGAGADDYPAWPMPTAWPSCTPRAWPSCRPGPRACPAAWRPRRLLGGACVRTPRAWPSCPPGPRACPTAWRPRRLLGGTGADAHAVFCSSRSAEVHASTYITLLK
ncbi:unnamed protein product [Prorocentrum cordatum]|uniref:Uncharacterized protein n=1 Tax=Prorocentrum cordatum TaxID=2364126 RepID=A0ABN9TS47_9DINO|nr:unnamed protein product [Polarella glacialis]